MRGRRDHRRGDRATRNADDRKDLHSQRVDATAFDARTRVTFESAKRVNFQSARTIDKHPRPIRVNQSEKHTREAVMRLAIARGLHFMIIDEANLMCVTAGTHSPEHHLEGLRVFCQLTGVVLILAGTVRLLQLWDNSAQLNRKMHTVHVRRYHLKDSDSMECVLGILDCLQKELGLVCKPASLLSDNVERIMRVTGGVYGEMRSLLRRVQIIQSAAGEGHVTERSLISAFPSARAVKRLYAEAQAIEMAFQPWSPHSEDTDATTPRPKAASAGRRASSRRGKKKAGSNRSRKGAANSRPRARS